ncbi:hypothetical protein UO65_6624 [Actinokineospora spheciospongiae]|uniref:Uncharacterized protein n=1 Tax=Actinokineospora spheciospongiae TaxID=909613 RepID=W7IMX6_9PSEU|nr:hypothetical protein UO65_6624 [Actinokineospora spheciospongiae]
MSGSRRRGPVPDVSLAFSVSNRGEVPHPFRRASPPGRRGVDPAARRRDTSVRPAPGPFGAAVLRPGGAGGPADRRGPFR